MNVIFFSIFILLILLFFIYFKSRHISESFLSKKQRKRLKKKGRKVKKSTKKVGKAAVKLVKRAQVISKTLNKNARFISKDDFDKLVEYPKEKVIDIAKNQWEMRQKEKKLFNSAVKTLKNKQRKMVGLAKRQKKQQKHIRSMDYL